jgi:hypothetical protein
MTTAEDEKDAVVKLICWNLLKKNNTSVFNNVQKRCNALRVSIFILEKAQQWRQAGACNSRMKICCFFHTSSKKYKTFW